jgi:hypothetical protein
MSENDGGQGGASGGGDNNAPAWNEGLSEAHAGVVEAKGWDSIGAVIDSYSNAEKLIGAHPDTILKLPTEMNAETMAPIYNKLGRPEAVDGYDFSSIAETNKDFVDAFAPLAHEAGLTKAQAETIGLKLNEMGDTAQTAADTEYKIQIEKEKQSLVTEWGSAHDEKIAAAKQAAQEFGLSPEAVQAIEDAAGYAETMKFFAGIGAKLGEAGFKDSQDGGGNDFSGAMTPAEAKSQLSQLENDQAFMTAWQDRGHPGHKDAVAKKSRLVSFAFPEG